MKKLIFISIVFFLMLSLMNVSAQQAQDQSQAQGQNEADNKMLFAYQKNFARGSLATKVQVLQDAASEKGGGMGKLYLQAIRFYLDNFSTLREDPTAIELVKFAARLAGETTYTPATQGLWNLFRQSSEIGIKVAAVQSLGRLLNPDEQLVTSIVNYLEVQNNKFRQGEDVENQVIAETITAVSRIGSNVAFSEIFAAAHLGYPQHIEEKALEALENLEGDTSRMVLQVIKNGFPQEKLAALKWAMEQDTLSNKKKGEIAQRSLSAGLTQVSNQEKQEKLRELRYEAVRQLTQLERSEASPLVIDHFDRTNVEVDRGIASKSNLLEAIACVGAMGTREAAVRLSLYLEVLNTYKENGQKVDEQVALAVIKNLGILGDEVAFDHLLYTMYLDYPRSVKQAAREVLSEFKE
ncbi:MAG: hypothetical protein U5P10_10230 [Spirochaetia bacterium]|nr:hypothetical protein [Spirochaetia bacterium]